jgi:hypothetical protein
MISKDLLPEIDPERVLRLRDASRGIGYAYLEYRQEKREDYKSHTNLLVAATYFRRAAAHSLLLNDLNDARSSFSMASDCYAKAGSSYNILMKVLSSDKSKRNSSHRQELRETATDVYLLFESLYIEKVFSDENDFTRKRLDEFRGKRIGVLPMPVEKYLDLYDTLKKVISRNRDSKKELQTVILPFVETFCSAFMRARKDLYHWKMLATPFHPVEPDTLGLLVMADAVLRPRDYLVKKIIRRLPVPAEPCKVLCSALESLCRQSDRRQDEEI